MNTTKIFKKLKIYLHQSGHFTIGAGIVFLMLFFIGEKSSSQESTGSGGVASAASSSSSGAKVERKQSLSFEDELVDGSTQKPELFYLFQKKNFNYKRLIRLRENFLPEMKKTSEDIQRVRSAN